MAIRTTTCNPDNKPFKYYMTDKRQLASYAAAPRGRNPSLRRHPSSSLLHASKPPELVAGKAGRRAGMAVAGPSSSAPPRPGTGVATMAAGRRGHGDGRRRRQIWSPRLAGVTGDGLGRRRHRSANLAGGWLAAAMVADVAATKLPTTAADCGAYRDAGPRQEPRHHEEGAAPSSMLRL
uniref:Uncharacterized protein n=1 Tax=Oryza nivara TaxID=4536 RepID=A0A0E0IYZ2_ORYNI